MVPDVVHPCVCRGDRAVGTGLFLWRQRFSLFLSGAYADEFLKDFLCFCFPPAAALLLCFNNLMDSADIHLQNSRLEAVPVRHLKNVLVVLPGVGCQGRLFIGLAYLCRHVKLHVNSSADLRSISMASREFLHLCVRYQITPDGSWERFVVGRPSRWKKFYTFFRFLFQY